MFIIVKSKIICANKIMSNRKIHPIFFLINFKPPRPLTPEEQLVKDTDKLIDEGYKILMEMQVKLKFLI